MRVLSLGDSVLIDDYTGQVGGGAASQFARMIRASGFEQTAGDGYRLERTYARLRQVEVIPDVVVLCAGGNDLLAFAWNDTGESVDEALAAMTSTFEAILERISMYGCKTIACTYFDPTDGNDAVSSEMGFRSQARELLLRYNDFVRSYPFIGVADTYQLFAGKGVNQPGTYLTLGVEVNLAGATVLAKGICEAYLKL